MGDCLVSLDYEAGQIIWEVETVPCTQPHRVEVYATVDIPVRMADNAHELSEWAERECTERLAAYSTAAATDPDTRIDLAYRSTQVICLATRVDLVTGSIAA